ncbi:retrovirus-related Pol polyprotein from transposon 412 [Trichonephila clavipes]|uniref:RNA-directed DNA polymerase n=1 Tax=Trichonephila clavipes TaxID=2585209 RepID=A0A8X7BFL4_TRICX|nr:retrovirus-related Pol polyprotein from transposon 412 [Trichonephila clavipes]
MQSEIILLALHHELRFPHDLGNFLNDWLDQSADCYMLACNEHCRSSSTFLDMGWRLTSRAICPKISPKVHYIETPRLPVTAKARRLAPNRLRIAKAEFQNMIALGHMQPSKSFKVSESGIEPLSDRVDCILNFPQPTTLTQLRRFLGLFNFYRRFVPKAAHLLAPLNKFLEVIKNFKNSKNNIYVSCKSLHDSIQWTEEAEQAFNDAKNALADATLLRHPIPDFEALSKAQREDNELQSFQNDEKFSLVFKRVLSPVSDTELICDTSTGSPRPFVPFNFRRTLFEHFHNLAHPGVAASFQLIASRYVWPNMRKTVKDWVQNCIACQSSKVHRHTKTPLGTYVLPDARFSHIHVDLIVYLTTGQGQQFEAALFKELTKFLGTNRIRTTSYHPQANGLVERLHRVLKSALMAHENIKWTETLPAVLGLRVAVKPNINASSAELVHGVSLRLPAEICTDTSSMPLDYGFVQQLKNQMNHLKPLSTSTHGFSKNFVHPKLDDCSHVFLRVDKVSPSLSQPYTGPHEVLSRNDKHITININGKKSCVSLDRVKPAFVFKDLPDPIPDPIISAESSHRHPVTINM